MTQPFDEVDRVVREAFVAETQDAFAGDDLLWSIHEAETAGSRRRFPTWAAAAAVLIVVALGALALLDRGGDRFVTAGPSTGFVPSTLPIPAVGEAVPGQLADGTPVWIVHHEDATISVLDAVSAHRPFGFGQLVGWCASSRGFEDPQHGSQFDEYGRYRAGPAPSGLSAYPTGPAVDSKVRVTGPGYPQPSARTAGGENGAPAEGPGCFEGVPDPGDPAGYQRGTLDLHVLAAEPGVPIDEAMSRPNGTIVVIRDAPVLMVAGRPTIVCQDALQESSPPRCDGPEAPDHDLRDRLEWALAEGTFVARVVDGALEDIAFVAGWTMQEGPSTR